MPRIFRDSFSVALRRASFALALCAALLPAASRSVFVDSALAENTPPNFFIIITDDQRYDTMGPFMPITQAEVFDQGVAFEKAYVTTPACCPSRSSIFTGMYAHNHGVRLNELKLTKTTFMQMLSQAGYFTGIAGKYLNSWPGIPRPEFNFWSVFRFGDSAYFNPILNRNGIRAPREGYLTDLLKDDALDFLTEAAAQPRPFMFLFTPFSPHAPSEPLPEDAAKFEDLPPFRPPNYGTKDLSSKPRWIREREQLSKTRLARIDIFRKNQLRTNLAVDRAVGAILARMRELNVLDNTVVLFISDNGVLWGEHGLTSKDCVYEPAIRVPFAIRYPPLIPSGRIESRQVANIDIAPTLLNLANLPVPAEMDGTSLVPLLNQTATAWRESIIIEGWRNDANRRPFRAIHTGTHVYVESKGGEPELYDLAADPYQMKNLAKGQKEPRIEKALRSKLRSAFSHARKRREKSVP